MAGRKRRLHRTLLPRVGGGRSGCFSFLPHPEEWTQWHCRPFSSPLSLRPGAVLTKWVRYRTAKALSEPTREDVANIPRCVCKCGPERVGAKRVMLAEHSCLREPVLPSCHRYFWLILPTQLYRHFTFDGRGGSYTPNSIQVGSVIGYCSLQQNSVFPELRNP